jgi:hypothetical protein
MRWTSDWRIYYVAAALFLIAGTISFFNDGLGVRPVLGLAMFVGMAMIGHKARKDMQSGLPPS